MAGQSADSATDPREGQHEVLADGDLAEAILDRLLERGAHFAMRGRSHRTRHLRPEDPPSPGDTTN